jgi:hypothetical protein
VGAQPFANGAAAGTVSTGLYILRAFDLTSNLPIMIIDGYGKGKPPKPMNSQVANPYFDAAVMIFEPVGGTADVSKLPTIATRAGYHVRGQSSASFPQTPYKVEMWDNANNDAKYSVLGMPGDGDWALIPPYYDRSLIRNPFTYTLGQDMGLTAPRNAFAEVFINYADRAMSMDDYQGIYWISETLEINKHRLDVAQLKDSDLAEPEITGGYMFKFDQAATDSTAPHLTCTGSGPLSGTTGMGMIGGGAGGRGGTMAGTCWTDCEQVDPAPLPMQQLTWITQYVQSFHNTLFTTPMGDYSQYIDVASFVDYLIISELTRNVDAYVRSAFFHKDRNAKLQGGPLWDYNFALGVGGSTTIDPMGGWQYQGTTAGSLPSRNVNSWFPMLMKDPNFVSQVKARWKTLRQGIYSQTAIDQRITDLIAPLQGDAVARDYAKWPVNKVYPNTTGFVRGPTDPTFDGQIQALRTFLSARLTWMDAQWQ